MKKLFYLAVLSVSLFSCAQQAENKEVETFEEVVDAPMYTDTSCYVYKQEGTDINFQIYRTGEEARGKLYYALSEKDKNDGDFEGRFSGDTLLGVYTFTSEGKRSVRQITFLKKDNTLIEGYGDIEQFGDTVRFKNPRDLNYTSTMLLQKVDCNK